MTECKIKQNVGPEQRLQSSDFMIECLDKTLRVDKIEIHADINLASLAHVNFSRISDNNELEEHIIVHPLNLKTGKLRKPPFSSEYQNLKNLGIDLDDVYVKANTLLISRPLTPKQLDHINDLSDQLAYYTKNFGYLRNTLETVLAIDRVKIEAKGAHLYIVFDVVRFDDEGFHVHSSFEIVDPNTGLVASDPDTRLLNPKAYGRRRVLRDELNEYLVKSPISKKSLSKCK